MNRTRQRMTMVIAVAAIMVLARLALGPPPPDHATLGPDTLVDDAYWGSLSPGETPLVLTSLYVIADLARAVGGERVVVESLLPAGADPHVYELRPSQVAAAESANRLLAIGLGLDPFMDRLAAAVSDAPAGLLGKLGESIPKNMLISGDGHHGHHDPHIWLDPTMVRDFVLPWLVDTLSALDPDGEDDFTANAAKLALALNELDEWAAERLKPFSHKGLITVHPAWNYFARRYGFEAWALEVAHGVEPSARYIIELLDLANERDIRTLFRELHTPERGLTTLVQSVGGKVMILDPLGGADLAGYDGYLELMRSNVQTVVEGLSIQ